VKSLRTQIYQWLNRFPGWETDSSSQTMALYRSEDHQISIILEKEDVVFENMLKDILFFLRCDSVLQASLMSLDQSKIWIFFVTHHPITGECLFDAEGQGCIQVAKNERFTICFLPPLGTLVRSLTTKKRFYKKLYENVLQAS